MIFKRRKAVLESVSEQRFDDMMELVKDLSRADYNRLKQAMDLSYEGYQKIKSVRSEEEKMVEDIVKIEESLDGEK